MVGEALNFKCLVYYKSIIRIIIYNDNLVFGHRGKHVELVAKKSAKQLQANVTLKKD